MSRIVSNVVSNVYYLPPPAVAGPEPDVRRRPSLGGRARHLWFRLRLTLSELKSALLRPRRRYGMDDYGAFFDGDAEMMSRVRPRLARPGTVLDFEAARRRLRPV
ncbi:MAG: hypothetical protein HYR86_07620 [Candidatus Rokubacteria bacterium]|nr:hypothetical protein [Candidatus Rokubacteria bacterium]